MRGREWWRRKPRQIGGEGGRGMYQPPPVPGEAGGRSVDGRIVGVTAPPLPELVKAVGRSVAGPIIEGGGDIFKVILMVFRVEA